jgi:hypothetical protein
MRTEDDVRAALLALENQAPSAEKMLDAVRAAGARRGPGPARALRSPRSPRWPQLVTAGAMAAAAAGLTIALLPGGAPSGGTASGGTASGDSAGPGQASLAPVTGAQGPQGAAGLPSAAALGRAMLTASTAATGDILYTTLTGGVDRGVITTIDQEWMWPANPVPGQQARWREALAERLSRTKPLLPAEDIGFTYTVPRGNPDGNRASEAYGHLTDVCYPIMRGCAWGSKGETPAGAWSQHTGKFINPGAGNGDLSPAGIAKAVAKGQWRVTGRTRVAGQPAIELSETRTGVYRPLPTTLWVSARTHLPIRMNIGAGRMWAQNNWRYLRPTAGNMALLQVPVPRGYRRVR